MDLDFNLTDRITAIELTWSLVALFGLVVCAWALVDSWLDRRALEVTNTDGPALVTVQINTRAALAGIALHAFFLVLGIAAMLTPASRQTLIGNVFGLGFILVAAANAGTIARNQFARIKLRRYVRGHPQHRRAKDPHPGR